MAAKINRRALTAGLLATAVVSAPRQAVAQNGHSDFSGRSNGLSQFSPRNAAKRPLRGDDTTRLPDHAAFWARLPLPFSLTDAWHKLSPATQAEIGTAVLGMALAQYVYGDGRAEADQFTDEGLRSNASDVADDLLNRIDDRLWALLPDMYGPEGDHPAWAYAAGMVYPLGTVLTEPEAEPTPAAVADPIFAAIEAADAARLAHQAAHEGLDESDDAQMGRLDALVDADRAAFAALAEVIPATRRGDVALADFYLRVLDDPDGQATAHLGHLRDVLADSIST